MILFLNRKIFYNLFCKYFIFKYNLSFLYINKPVSRSTSAKTISSFSSQVATTLAHGSMTEECPQAVGVVLVCVGVCWCSYEYAIPLK